MTTTKERRSPSALVTLPVLALVVLLVTAPATGLVVDSLVEEVDISSLVAHVVTVTYAFPSGIQLPSTVDLDRRCSILSTALSCAAAVDEVRHQVVFTVIVTASITVDDLTIGDTTVTAVLAHDHLPVQFALASGIETLHRKLMFRYPTHDTVVDGIQNAPVHATFDVRKERSELDIDLPVDQITAGEAIAMPPTNGLMCIGALLRGTDVLAIASSSKCGPFHLILPPTLRSGTYRLALVSLGRGPARVAEADIEVSPSQSPVALELATNTVALGEPVIATVTSEGALDTCTTSLMSPDGNEVELVEHSDCDHLAVGTSTSWAPGVYLFQVTTVGERGSAAVSASVTLMGLAPESVDIITDDYYRPGDELTVIIKGGGEACDTVLMNGEMVEVTREDGCGEQEIQLDDTLEPGTYIVQSRVYDHGRLTGMASKAITVGEWLPVERSPMEALCPRGAFRVDGEPVPCIAEGERCSPSSQSLPMCLCFDGEGEPVDACRPTDMCTVGGCLASPARSPYVIVQVPGSCTARRGSEVFGCITLGEMCDGYCVCLDEEVPVAFCDPSQTCTADGCAETVLEFQVNEVTPRELTASDVDIGTDLSINGVLRHRGTLLDIAAAADVAAHGRLDRLPPQNATVDVSGTVWQFSLPVKGRLSPGTYESVLGVYYDGHLAAVRQPVDVLYPPDSRMLTVNVLSSRPKRIDAADLKMGIPVRLELDVRNPADEPVGDLRPEDFIISLGTLRPDAVVASYDPEWSTWSVIATFQSTSLPRTNYVTVTVSSLSRNGTAREPLKVIDVVSTSIHITHIRPGSADEPLYRLLMTVGFSMDIYLSLTANSQVGQHDFRVTLAGTDVSDTISYIASTNDGLRLHLTQVILPVSPSTEGGTMELIVALDGPEGTISDSVTVISKDNPGKWRSEGSGST